MFAHERQERIAALTARQGQVSVQELAQLLDVTQETVRRDLDQLESAGVLRRVHGGAISPERLSLAEPSLDERQSRNLEQKNRIAEAALAYIPASDSTDTAATASSVSVILDAGTTTELLAARLAAPSFTLHRASLLAITNALPIAYRLSSNPAWSVEILGGRIRGLTSAAVGSSVTHQLSGLRPDIAYIGANGIHAEFGLSTPDSLEAAVKTAMVTSARRVVALVDSSKLDQETLVRFASLDQIDVLITDQTPGPSLTAALKETGVDVVIA
ncbi:DeoR/GlpR family DNA-binding transcription regulator [Psychromicrobium xiongbiense]|uniref:DeoR/GlpR family DNA-binding transcription regulator n=1 Tax=Psychromicrobium xiongbiense TaxID=3051184 RepID=UPI0025566A78|nr:DeoR/GlpR family DNA-binding transcription regulator [Psychromicrobium sp. YIM S02556]